MQTLDVQEDTNIWIQLGLLLRDILWRCFCIILLFIRFKEKDYLKLGKDSHNPQTWDIWDIIKIMSVR